MKNLISLTFFLGLSTCLLSQTVTVSNTTNCDYMVKIFGSNTSPTTSCSSCYVFECIPAGQTVAVDLNTGSGSPCGADTYVTMSQVIVQDPCVNPTCTSTNTVWTSPTGCNSYPSSDAATNSCNPSPCSNTSTTVNWTSSFNFTIS
jgi:hypothetical protein